MKVRILAIAASAFLIASCGVTDRAGAAAIVGGQKISSADVAAQVKEVRFDIEHADPQLLQTIPTEALKLTLPLSFFLSTSPLFLFTLISSMATIWKRKSS